jgi:hypothetical protein
MEGVEMPILRIQHQVPSFDDWKAAFDSDPIGRQQGGVRRHWVMRPVDDPNTAMIDLEFDSVSDAEEFLGKLRTMWSRVEGTLMMNPEARIVEVVDGEGY